MNEKIKRLLDKSNEFIEFIKDKSKNSNSFVYSSILIATLIAYGFFFNSNAILKDSGVNYTTSLFEIKKVDNLNVELRERKYCKSSNMVEFYIYADDSSTLYSNTLDFELKERNNPSENIPVDIRRVDKNNYVIRAEVPKKWTVLSLGVMSFNPLEVSVEDEIENENDNNKAKNISSSSTVKFYSEYDDMKKVNNLDMKKSEEYLYEFADLEIESINKKIVKLSKSIQEKNNTIDSYNENINRLEEDKVYQTENENKSTDTKISSIKTIINTEQDNINKLNEEKKDLQEKIKKLEDKKRTLSKKM